MTAEGAGKAFVVQEAKLQAAMDSAAAAAAAAKEGGGGGGGTDAVTTTTTATCACCGMDEECTPRYVARVAAQFGGAWVCGLCAEAIKDEAARRGVGLDAARRAHAEFVVSSSAAAGAAGGSDGPAVQVVRALLQLLKKVIAAAPAGAAAALPPATPAPHEMHVGNNHDLVCFESACM